MGRARVRGGARVDADEDAFVNDAVKDIANKDIVVGMDKDERNRARAGRDVLRLEALGLDTAADRSLLSGIRARAGSRSEALEAIEQALAEDPNQAKDWISYAKLLNDEGETSKALDAADRCLELDRQCGEAWALTAQILAPKQNRLKEALKEAARILIHHFMLFSDEKITLEEDEKSETEEFDETSLHMRQLLKTRLVDMDLSVRALNCLKAAEVDTLGDLVSYNKNDLMKFRNFGKKSLTELEELVVLKGLSFGMDLAKYKLDKD